MLVHSPPVRRRQRGIDTRTLCAGFFGSLLVSGALILASPSPAVAQNSEAPPISSPIGHDGRHDFDWDIGVWKTHQKRLLHPLTGSTQWVEYEGTDSVRKVWDGANTGIIEADGSAGHLEIFTLRLYNPQSGQWSISFATRANGALSTPVIGSFSNGRGEFYDQETYNGRAILVRFEVFAITPTSCRFEQSFSSDGGKSWETNFVVSETRVSA